MSKRALKKELRAQRKMIARLARILYTHARTDLAPDACLPTLRKFLLGVRA